MADSQHYNIGVDDYNKNFGNLPTHEEYRNNIHRWKFLMRSYLGGSQYKMGRYLTRYVYETENEYLSRIAQTPLPNHVKQVVHIHNSFLFRQNPRRDYGNLENTQELEQFLKDCDMEGRDFDSFMRDVNIMSSIYGSAWILVDRPDTVVGTRAEELSQNIRPYLNLYTPETVIDWNFERLPNGAYELTMVKFLESDESTYGTAPTYHIRTWTKDSIFLEKYSPYEKEPLTFMEEKPNALGKVPVVICYANRSPIKGVGVSDVGDIADSQTFLFNLYSEAEALIRLTNHPTVVKTPDVDVSAGAGAIITMPNETDAGLKPYLLQPNGQNLDAILKTIESTIDEINRMGHLGAIRATESRQLSGVSRQSEFLMLDSKLCEKARNLELTEENIWRLFSQWQGEAWTGEVNYPMAFHVRDKSMDMDLLEKASRIQRDSTTAMPKVKDLIDRKMSELLMTEQELDMVDIEKDTTPQTQMTHPPMTNPEEMIKHMRSMVQEGYTDQQIMEIHPEIKQFFGANNGEETSST
jgi:hypothetical protein